MLTKGPLGGAVLSLAPTAVLLAVGEIVGVRRYGYTRDVDVFRIAVLRWGVLVQCALGAILSGWTFSRLQEVEDREMTRALGVRSLVRRPATLPPIHRRSCIWLLVRKE